VGDRIAQIGAIFATATERNQPRFEGDVPVIVDFELVRFHGVTERTRYSIGGVYNIVFNMSVRNAGQTEKVRVTDFLTQVFKDELSGTYDI